MRYEHADLWKMTVCAAVMSRRPTAEAFAIADAVVEEFTKRFPDERPDSRVEVRG